MRRLETALQQYAWGKGGSNSMVAQLKKSEDSDFDVQESQTYAELWMGTHPNGPSRVMRDAQDRVDELRGLYGSREGPGMFLIELLETYPHYLGDQEDFGDLPFMFKVLSINKALSIQAHPDKRLAERLYATRPDLYKDDNHKPEMAVALSDFEGLCGFRPFEEIVYNLDTYPELRLMVGDEATSLAFGCTSGVKEDEENALRVLFRAFVTANPDVVAKQVSILVGRLRDELRRSLEEEEDQQGDEREDEEESYECERALVDVTCGGEGRSPGFRHRGDGNGGAGGGRGRGAGGGASCSRNFDCNTFSGLCSRNNSTTNKNINSSNRNSLSNSQGGEVSSVGWQGGSLHTVGNMDGRGDSDWGRRTGVGVILESVHGEDVVEAGAHQEQAGEGTERGAASEALPVVMYGEMDVESSRAKGGVRLLRVPEEERVGESGSIPEDEMRILHHAGDGGSVDTEDTGDGATDHEDVHTEDGSSSLPIPPHIEQSGKTASIISSIISSISNNSSIGNNNSSSSTNINSANRESYTPTPTTTNNNNRRKNVADGVARTSLREKGHTLGQVRHGAAAAAAAAVAGGGAPASAFRRRGWSSSTFAFADADADAMRRRRVREEFALKHLMLRLATEYPGDIGIMMPLLLNYLRMGEGESFFMAANEPHAYLKGDILEVMARSDNVVRVALTPKHRDVPLLCQILTYNMGAPPIVTPIQVDECCSRYSPPIKDFEMLDIEVAHGKEYTAPAVPVAALAIVMGGTGYACDGADKQKLCRGMSFFIPARTPVVYTSTSLEAGRGGETLWLCLARSNLSYRAREEAKATSSSC